MRIDKAAIFACEAVVFHRRRVLLKEQAAAILGIKPRRIDEYLASHWPELTRLGYEVLRGEARRSLSAALEGYESEILDLRAIANAPALSILEEGAFELLARLIGAHTPTGGSEGQRILRAKPSPAGPPAAANVARKVGAQGKGEATPGIVRAISIRQPYVEQILQGTKVEEYRSQKTNIRERVYLYASMSSSKDEVDSWEEIGLEPGSLSAGFVVGSVEIVDCRWDDECEYYAYALENPERLEAPRKPLNQPQPKIWIPRFA